MEPSNRSRKNRNLLVAISLIGLAAFIVAGFSGALAARSVYLHSLFFPLILQAESTPGAGTSTPTVTSTATATATQGAKPTRTSTPTSTQKPSPTPVAGDGKVRIVDFAFQPVEITIHVGKSVEWENTGQFSHTATSDTGVWDSGFLAHNGKFSFVFNTPGDYPYHCSLHPGMTGIVHVVP